jgi:hypothetical protein
VYIAEAHPSDLWQMQSNLRDRVIFRNPTTMQERERVATSCVRKLHVAIPALMDGIDNRVEQQYTSWPDRLYLIGADGLIQYKSEPGPFGFDPKKLEAALRSAVAHT